MSTRSAAGAFPIGQRQAGPVHRSILAVDLEGSTTRTNPVKGELRRVIYHLLARSLEEVAITGNRLEPLIDRGDGVLALIKPHDDVPKTVLLGRLVPRLTTLLAEQNAQAALPALRIRLRVVVHAGEVHADSRGFYGEAIDVAIRLLDSPRVKETLKQAAAPLVLVVSEEIHSSIICQGYVPADSYLPLVRVRVANRWHRGWVHIPAAAAAAGAGCQQWSSADRAQQAHLRFRASATGHKRAVLSGHR
jgi:hypothetical protein